jgi:hypothetical protein
MQPDDDRNEGAQLNGLLREWVVPDAPPNLEQRVLRRCKARDWWRLLFTGYVRVPVAVLYVLAVLVTATVWKVAAHGPGAPCVAVAHSAPASGEPGTLAGAAGKASHCDHSAPGFC